MCVEMVLPLVNQGVTRCLAGLEYCVRGRDRAWGGSVATSHTGTVIDRRRRLRPAILLLGAYACTHEPFKYKGKRPEYINACTVYAHNKYQSNSLRKQEDHRKKEVKRHKPHFQK